MISLDGKAKRVSFADSPPISTYYGMTSINKMLITFSLLNFISVIFVNYLTLLYYVQYNLIKLNLTDNIKPILIHEIEF